MFNLTQDQNCKQILNVLLDHYMQTMYVTVRIN